MIKIAVVDVSAESRGRLIDRLDSFLRTGVAELQLLPRVSLKPISPQELKFNAAPDVCLVGPEVVDGDMTEIARIKKIFPNSPLIVWLDQKLSTLSVVEQIARQGADDVLTFDATAQYFFRRLLITSRKAVHQSSGKLVVVDGGKGGVGVTTIAAALGELASSNGKRVAVIDCDFETQDCSRFLQARPFLNENLRMLLDEERAVTEESVAHCLSAVWQDDQSLRCMPPVAESEDLYDPRSNLSRTFLSILEILDASNDLVIIDIGCARSTLQKMLYRVADKLVFVVNDDPASLYASVDKLTRARTQLSAGAQLMVVENSVGLSGLGNKLLRQEFSRAAKLDPQHWSPEPIAFCKIGQRWPGSGSTFFSQAKSASAKSIEKLAKAMSLHDEIEAKSRVKGFFSIFNRSERESATAALPLASAPIYQSGSNSGDRLIGFKEQAEPKAQKLIEHSTLGNDEFDLDSLVGAAKPL